MSSSRCIRHARQPFLHCPRHPPPRLPKPVLLPISHRHLSFSTLPSALYAHRHPPPSRLDEVSHHRQEAERRAYYQRRFNFAAIGMVLSMLGTLVVVYTADIPVEKNDAPSEDPLNKLERGTPVIRGVSGGTELRKPGQEGTASGIGEGRAEDDEQVEQVPTGTSTIPTFPKTIQLPSEAYSPTSGSSTTSTTEYQLLGLGIRTVSFLSIQVYVVGLYIAMDDISALQETLIRQLDPVATTLIKSEKDKLRSILLDPDKSSDIWARVLKDTSLRTAIRIVPTRNTDFQHLRDGWVRGITGRTLEAKGKGPDAEVFEDEAFGAAMKDFKGLFSGAVRKSVPKGKTLVLMRGRDGAMSVLYDDGRDGQGVVRMGGVKDERIARLVWLNYLGGKKVASEGARQSVVEGVMEFVERPVGTVATQVV
ncbi:MAG: Altered inheritance of mitochondria protein 18 mitochondrial [Piccolia ochrophora]|nr:MAG: Altered inheritance of mitochondria protein 18 mitochondrial [Piccolia ochrophora]